MTSSGSNLAWKLEDNLLLITPTQVYKGDICLEDLVFIYLEGGIVEGQRVRCPCLLSSPTYEKTSFPLSPSGLAVGFWKYYDELRANWGKDKEWTPNMDAKLRKGLYSVWKKAITRTFDWDEQ